MNTTVDGRRIPYQIVESITWHGKPRTIVLFPFAMKCGHVQNHMANLDGALANDENHQLAKRCALTLDCHRCH